MAYEVRGFSGVATETALTSLISAVDTTLSITLGTGASYPSSGSFYVVVDLGLSTEEKILCSAQSANALTVASGGRGADGTPATAHVVGASVKHVIAAVDLSEANRAVNRTVGQITAVGELLVGDALNSLNNLAPGANNTVLVADSTVTGVGLKYTTLGPSSLATDSVTTVKILDANVTTGKLADSSVTTLKLANNNVTTAKILDDNVTTAKILDGNVTTAKLAANAVTAAKITAATITATELASNAVTTAKILDANVTTSKILDANVTTAKILDDNVTTSKILDANVTTAKIADLNVTTAKIAANAITTGKIAASSITNALTSPSYISSAIATLGHGSTLNVGTISTGASGLIAFGMRGLSFIFNGTTADNSLGMTANGTPLNGTASMGIIGVGLGITMSAGISCTNIQLLTPNTSYTFVVTASCTVQPGGSINIQNCQGWVLAL